MKNTNATLTAKKTIEFSPETVEALNWLTGQLGVSQKDVVNNAVTEMATREKRKRKTRKATR